MSKLHLTTAVLLAVTTVAACSSAGGGPTAQPSGAPTVAPTPTATPEGLVHPTGPTDVILSFDREGGFVPPEWLAGHVPIFTLYGDGTAVFVQTTAEMPARDDGIGVNQPLRTARLTEDQVQALLLYALQDGGLAVAKEKYENMMVADAPTAVFTISADNDTKKVSAYGLGFDAEPSVDTVVLKKLAALAERLSNFDQDGSLGGTTYKAHAYRAILTEQVGLLQGVAIRDWPWADLAVSDFTFPADPNALQQATALITPDQADAIGIEGYEGGLVGGLFVKDATKLYSLVIRPLLPHETT